MSILDRAFDIATEDSTRQWRSESYFNDPNAWALDVAGVHLWSLQREVAISVRDNKNTAVKAGHGVGKSLLAAVLICWWIDTRYPNAFVASTAPSNAQISAILWREIRKLKDAIEKRHTEYVNPQDYGIVTHRHKVRI